MQQQDRCSCSLKKKKKKKKELTSEHASIHTCYTQTLSSYMCVCVCVCVCVSISQHTYTSHTLLALLVSQLKATPETQFLYCIKILYCTIHCTVQYNTISSNSTVQSQCPGSPLTYSMIVDRKLILKSF